MLTKQKAMSIRQKAKLLIRQQGCCTQDEQHKHNKEIPCMDKQGHNICPCAHICDTREGTEDNCLKCAEEWLKGHPVKRA